MTRKLRVTSNVGPARVKADRNRYGVRSCVDCWANQTVDLGLTSRVIPVVMNEELNDLHIARRKRLAAEAT